MSRINKSWVDASSGAAAGAVAKTATAPLERVKLVMQNQELAIGRAASSPVVGIGNALRQLSAEPAGLFGFWRGNGVNILRVLPTYATRFTLYYRCEQMLTFIGHHDVRRLCAGGLAGAGALLVTHPLDTVRTRLAAARIFAEERTYHGLHDCIRSTWNSEGIRGFYAGGFMSLLEITPYTAVAFAGYEGVKQRLGSVDHGNLSMGSKIIAGIISGVAATMTCYPLDTIRRQMMLEGAHGFDARYKRSIAGCCMSLWHEGRLKRLYRGCSVAMVKSVPTVTITFFTNDWLHEILK